MRHLFPPLARDLEAILVTGGGRVDGRTLRDGLLAAAVQLGAVRRAGHVEVDHDKVDHGGVDHGGKRPAIMVDGERLDADAVVLAAGAWTSALLAKINFRLPVAPQKGQITHLRVEADTSNWPTVLPSHHYLVAFDDSRVAVGATRETGSGFDTRVTAAGQLQVLRDALSVAPGLADATLIETRVGLRPLTDDLPIAGAVPGHDGLYVATGYGAAGLTMGPLIGDAIARQVLGQPAPELAAVAVR
ncbi:FAD-dependent oxidoreductase [Microlunatus elymi]|uniref:FAD-dependent oxidoreductase n=1 Tax=Microlunatus elymi TaxID=2596828 RepID=A0A516PY47_9ACTN|nr:FAD-dependent oxidoreductase [Microlunatus elymi]QDP95891.1 FAD-dependent oxidoreductase [Microlunatus elymi]